MENISWPVEKPRSGNSNKPTADRVLMIPAMLMGAGIMFLVLPTGYRIELARCPAGTFLTGLSQNDQARSGALVVAGSVITMIIIWAVLMQVFGKLVRMRTRRRAGGILAIFGIDSRQKKMVLAGAASTLAIGSIALSLWAFTPKFCLTDAAIFLRPGSVGEFHRYTWNQVSIIDTVCYPTGRGHWHTSSVVTMRDGANFDLLTAGRHVPPVYSRIGVDLKGVDYVFSSPEPKTCGAPLRDVVISRP
jgi:hypothetical protein